MYFWMNLRSKERVQEMKFLTSKEMAETVHKRITKELPAKITNILDYYACVDEKRCVDLYDIEFDVKGDLHFGSNEGIYLHMYMEGVFQENGERTTAPIITYKTLYTNKEAMKMMAEIQAEFIWQATKWIEENEDQLTRRGWRVKKNETDSASIICYTDENLKKRIKAGYRIVECLKTRKLLTEKEVNAIETS